MERESLIEKQYELAKQQFADFGIDTDKMIEKADSLPISMHCWQGDSFHGFESKGDLTGGIAVTGDYPGCPRTPEELRADIDFTFGMFPGTTRFNLHSNYAEDIEKGQERNSYTEKNFKNWIDWAKEHKIGLDFNPTFFSSDRMDGNFTLTSENEKVRKYWLEHGKACRKIGEAFGKALGTPSVVNFWMPDGFKDIPADKKRYRERMAESLDEIFSEKIDEKYEIDSVESKLFGFGIESYTVASHEFSYGYAITRNKTYCIDMGHFHPTEDISDKISSALLYLPHLLIHTSRGVRWDSDHVVLWDDNLKNVMREIIHGGYEDKVFVAQDYFDGSMNRIACWTIAMRNTRQAILNAYLEPIEKAKECERQGDLTARALVLENNKHLPYDEVWNYYCLTKNVPVGNEVLLKIKDYENKVLLKRD